MGASGSQLTAATQVRLAVRAGLRDLPADAAVAVGVSGGRDSLALMLATLAVAPALRLRVSVWSVDHGWSEGSRSVSESVVTAARSAGATCAEVLQVPAAPDSPPDVATSTEAGAGAGPEGQARTRRYAAFDRAVLASSVQTVLIGHTLDDQAETVLIGLARGSGPRSLAGMADHRDHYRRPLLGVRRQVVRQALDELAAAGLPMGWPAGLPWEDPSNADRALLRPRIRHDLVPVLERTLGPGAVEALARTAELARADADALDGWARSHLDTAPEPLGVTALTGLPEAVRSRVLRQAVARAGGTALTAAHTTALLALAGGEPGSGAGPLALPGGVAARRHRGRLTLGPATSAPGDDEEL